MGLFNWFGKKKSESSVKKTEAEKVKKPSSEYQVKTVFGKNPVTKVKSDTNVSKSSFSSSKTGSTRHESCDGGLLTDPFLSPLSPLSPFSIYGDNNQSHKVESASVDTATTTQSVCSPSPTYSSPSRVESNYGYSGGNNNCDDNYPSSDSSGSWDD